MMRYRAGYVLLAVAVVGVACAAEIGESRDAPTSSQEANAAARDDDAVGALLAAVRVDDPLLCALAVERIDQRGRWSRWDRTGDDLLDADSATAARLQYLDRSPAGDGDVARLTAALRDNTRCVRRVAASLLARIEHPAAAAALREALTDARPDVREVAALGSGMAEAPSNAAALVRLLEDSSARVRHSAAWALGAIAHRGAMERLLELLASDAEPQVRQAAAWAVGRIASS